MEHFAIYNDEGRILRTGLAPIQMLSTQTLDTGEYLFSGQADDATQYVLSTEADALVLARPSLESVLPASGPLPWQWGHEGVPDGTQITVIDDLGHRDTYSTPSTDLRLLSAGTFTLRVSPPFPFMPAEVVVEVSDA